MPSDCPVEVPSRAYMIDLIFDFVAKKATFDYALGDSIIDSGGVSVVEEAMRAFGIPECCSATQLGKIRSRWGKLAVIEDGAVTPLESRVRMLEDHLSTLRVSA